MTSQGVLERVTVTGLPTWRRQRRELRGGVGETGLARELSLGGFGARPSCAAGEPGFAFLLCSGTDRGHVQLPLVRCNAGARRPHPHSGPRERDRIRLL